MDIRVVLHGNGPGLLMTAKEDDALQTVAASLGGREIGCEEDPCDAREETMVPSGVAGLSRLQQEGNPCIRLRWHR